MKFVFIMDPITSVRPYKDTSYFLMLAAQQKGHEVYECQINDLFYLNGVKANVRSYKIKEYSQGDTYKEVFQAVKSQDLALDTVDIIWIRKDPPFDADYLYMTRLLSLCKKTKIINSPSGLQAWNEKLAALEFKDWIPWTMVSMNLQQIMTALNQRPGRFVLKPLDGFGGKGIEFISSSDPNVETHIQRYLEREMKAIIIQEYLVDAAKGDKRILLWKGKPLGAVLRLHADGKELNNIDAGGTALATEISAKELELCQLIGPTLIKLGLDFVGIDIIGERLTEVNITSPTTLQEMSRLLNRKLHHEIIEDLQHI